MKQRLIETDNPNMPSWMIDPSCSLKKAKCVNPACLLKLSCCGCLGETAFKEKEQVNHPDHYGGEDNPYEVIKVLRAWSTNDEFYGWLKLTILKYLGRLDAKGSREVDLDKALWYMNYLKEWLKEPKDPTK
jgi:hypothetical protein